MELNYEHLVKQVEAWLPVVLEYGGKVALALITLAGGWWLISILTSRVGDLLAKRSVDRTLQGFVGSLVSIILKILLIVSVVSMIGVQTTSFVAVIGAAGLAVGLALQGNLSNFAGGVLILLFRPFKIGDWIEAQGVSGTVDSILIFHTVLRSGDNKRVFVPNGALSNSIVINCSAEPLRKVVFDVGVDYEADLKNAKRILLSMAEDSRVLKEPAPVAVVAGLGDSAITLSLRVWVKSIDYGDVMSMFNETVRDALGKDGISIPFPQRVVKIVQGAADCGSPPRLRKNSDESRN